jgi:hypothetical protein
MTTPPGRLADYVDLIEFVDENIDMTEARQLANRIGVLRKLKLREAYSGKEIWEAVLEASLSERCVDSFLGEIEKLIGDPQRPGFAAAKRTCAEAQFKTIIRQAHPDLYTVSYQLPRARTLGQLGEAGTACRELVLRILSAVEAGAPERSMLLSASNTADVDRLAERIGNHALNLLAIVDRLLDLTEENDELSAIQLYASRDPDDFGRFEGTPSDAQTLALARKARNAAWWHLQRLLILLTRNTILFDRATPNDQRIE